MKSFWINIGVTFFTYLLVTAFMHYGAFSWPEFLERIWPEGIVFIVLYGGLTGFLSYLRQKKVSK